MVGVSVTGRVMFGPLSCLSCPFLWGHRTQALTSKHQQNAAAHPLFLQGQHYINIQVGLKSCACTCHSFLYHIFHMIYSYSYNKRAEMPMERKWYLVSKTDSMQSGFVMSRYLNPLPFSTNYVNLLCNLQAFSALGPHKSSLSSRAELIWSR